MPYSLEFKQKAVNLRQKGYSIKEVSKILGIAKSTSSLWLRNIKLSKKAQDRLAKRGILGQHKSRRTNRKKREQRKQEYILWAKSRLKFLPTSKTALQAYCSILYWAEGGKFTDNHLEFTNSDPLMIGLFLRLLRKGFGIDESKLRANVHIHEYHKDAKQKGFWSKASNIPLEQFNKSYRKPHTKKRIRNNYPGCVRICYYSADTARKIQALYQNLTDYI
jgi:transposase-like protein